MNMSAARTYSNRSNCAAGARAALKNPAAAIDKDFAIKKGGDGRYTFSLAITSGDQAASSSPGSSGHHDDAGQAPVNLKDPGGITALATALKGADGITEPMPDVLKLPPESPEQADARRARNAKTFGPDREITMPKTTKAAAAKRGKAKGGSKRELLVKLLKGGWQTMDDICEATGWQAHSARAEISRLPGYDTVKAAKLKVDKKKSDAGTEYRLVKKD